MGGGGASRNFVQNELKSLWSMDFERRGRAGLIFVKLDKMLQMGIPFLLFTLTMFPVMCALCQALCGIYPAIFWPRLLRCFYPMLCVPEICGCSSFDLSTAGGGASSYQHMSNGEALWYTTCTLLVLLAVRSRLASHLFIFAGTPFPSHIPTHFCVARCTLFLYLNRPYRRDAWSPI